MKIRYFIVALGLFPMVVSGQMLPYQDTTLSFEERAADMVSRMTVAEKIEQLGHIAPAIDRLGLKAYNYWNEALHGVARKGVATVFPSSKAMSSTWNLDLVNRAAVITGNECRIKDILNPHNPNMNGLIYWSPTINMSRDPRWGRDGENYGEDPFLTGRMAVEFIKGMQGDDPKYYKTVATAKHFAANNYEYGRFYTSSNMDDRNLREYYLPAFEAAVKDANVRSIMSAYNALNGIPCGANYDLLQRILRDEWGFDGFITSDCWAVKYVHTGHHYTLTAEDAVAVSLEAGEDLNCGYYYQAFGGNALNEGLITEAQIDRALIHILTARFSVGEFDDPSLVKWTSIDPSILDCDAHRAVAYEAAQQSIVLLKNNDNFLPLTTDKKVAIIGPLGDVFVTDTYSGTPGKYSTLYEGVSSLYSFDNPRIEAENFSEKSGELHGEQNGTHGNLGFVVNGNWCAYDNVNFDNGKSTLIINYASVGGNPTVVSIYLDKLEGTPAAQVSLPVIGSWSSYKEISFEIDPDLFKGNHKVYVKFEKEIEKEKYLVNVDWMWFTTPVELEEGGPIMFVKGCDVNTTGDAAKIGFGAALEAARKADVVIFAAGSDQQTAEEDYDRTFLHLPGVQQELLEAVYAVNPNVVLTIQSAFMMSVNWAHENIPAIVEGWFNGQAQGQALADVLYGKFNPCGHLTTTWYDSINDLPRNMLQYDIRKAGYTYMYYPKTPLYAFGHGLSYTTFEYNDFALSAGRIEKDTTVDATVNVTNTGDRAGAEVVQLYVSYESAIDRPRIQLIGFARVELEPGETKSVTIPFKHEQLAYFNEASQTFDVEESDVKIHVGSASDNIHYTKVLSVAGATVKTTSFTEAAGVDGVITNPRMKDGIIYNLKGQPVAVESELRYIAPGIYILNGEKILNF